MSAWVVGMVGLAGNSFDIYIIITYFINIFDMQIGAGWAILPSLYLSPTRIEFGLGFPNPNRTHTENPYASSTYSGLNMFNLTKLNPYRMNVKFPNVIQLFSLRVWGIWLVVAHISVLT